MLRGAVLVLACITVLSAELFAHAGLRSSSPIEGVALGDTPSAVQLTFWEKPETALSFIHVIGTGGAPYHVGRPAPVPGDPLTLSIAVRPLGTGVYTVSWRVVSAVDGHAVSGTYAFGVRASPSGRAATSVSPRASRFEMAARAVLLAGLLVLVGAVAAVVGRFGGAHNLTLGACGWLLSFTGMVLLAAAQTRNAAAALADVLNTSVGRMLVWRAAAIVAAGVALAVAHLGTRWTRPRIRAGAMVIAGHATLAAIAVHVAGGHAAAGRWLDRSRFIADFELHPGLNRIAAVARTVDGARMRAVVAIDVPRR